MGKITGFMDYTRKTSTDVPPLERIENFNEFHVWLSREEQQTQAARCMDCGVPFCQAGMMIGGMASGCPLNKDYLYGTGNIYNLKAVGDWLFYVMSEYIQVDDPDGQGKNSFITLMNYMIYNTVTGELRELFPRNSVGESGAAPALISGTVYKNMIFVTLPEFAKDDDGAEKLVYVLRSYNVDNDKTTVLYTSDESFTSIAVTNKRIYISYMGGTEYKAYSVDRNGGDLRDEDDFYAPVVAYGNLGYCYHDANRRYALSLIHI